MRCQRAAPSGDGLHLAADGNRRRRLVVGDHDNVFAVLETPLTADQRRFRDIFGGERYTIKACMGVIERAVRKAQGELDLA